MCTSWLTQRAAASLEEASKARLATKANSTPLHARVPAGRAQLAQHLVDAQPVPHAVQHVRATQRPGRKQGQLGAGGHPQRRGGSSSRDREAISRWIAAGSTWSVRPKL